MQFRLRTLLIVLAISSLVLACARPIWYGRARKAAINEIVAQRGEVEFDERSAGNSWASSCLSFVEQLTNSQLDGSVKRIRFSPDIGDDDLRQLKVLPEALEVDLSYCYDISDDALASLTYCRRLEVLELYRNDPDLRNNFIRVGFDLRGQKRISDRALQYVSRCPTLRVLNLYDNDVTDAGLRQLYSMRRLQVVGLSGTKVTAGAVEQLQTALPYCNIVWIEPSAE